MLSTITDVRPQKTAEKKNSTGKRLHHVDMSPVLGKSGSTLYASTFLVHINQ